jgi:hypothetical protein
MPLRQPEQYSDEEAERRATDALRRAMTTPYKPQSELVGKKRRVLSNGNGKPSKSVPKAPEGGEA